VFQIETKKTHELSISNQAIAVLQLVNVRTVLELDITLATSLLRAHPDVDGVYMPCNKWRTVSVIERIEKDGGKPVLTNTQAWTWEAMRTMGC
jgi:maleate cis-trans isomerase